MKKYLGHVCLITLAALLMVLVVPAIPVFAATTADVAVNATPAYVSITNAPNNYGFGVVAVSTNQSTSTGYFTITDSSSVNIDISISTNATWAGGNTWTHSDAGTPASTTAALYASDNTGAFDVIVKNAAPNDLVSTSTGNFNWELRLMTPTVYDDAVLKTNTVTLTATAS